MLDRLARQRLADEHHVSTPLDRPVPAHPAHGVPGIIPGLLQPLGPRPGRGPTRTPQMRLLAERLVRPVGVEVLPEAVEARLLARLVRRRRPGRLRLQRPVHALVPPVLLRAARLDPLHAIPAASPPTAAISWTSTARNAGSRWSWTADSMARRRSGGATTPARPFWKAGAWRSCAIRTLRSCGKRTRCWRTSAVRPPQDGPRPEPPCLLSPPAEAAGAARQGRLTP